MHTVVKPDVVFLEVQMPGMDGFEVLRALPKENLPGVTFLTAYEQHALRAFEVHALDYLLKPVDDERFAAAVDRARKLVDSASKTLMVERILQMLGRGSEKYVSRFTVRTGSRIQLVLAEDVEWIGAAGDYAELHSRPPDKLPSGGARCSECINKKEDDRARRSGGFPPRAADAFPKKCLRQCCSGFELSYPFYQANSAEQRNNLLPANPPESCLGGRANFSKNRCIAIPPQRGTKNAE